MKQIQFQAQVVKTETMADGGMGVKLHTQEMPNEDKATLLGFGQELAWVTLSEVPTDNVEVPETLVETSTKTPSERLRAVMYRYWEQIGKPLSGFLVFYETQTEKHINAYKEKLQ